MSHRKAVSLFAGCGGFCEGARLAGFSIISAVEKDPYACETYRHNFPDVPLFQGDIHDFLNEGSVVWNKADRPQLEASAGDIELVFGGPPCQGFSQIGPRVTSDPRNLLYKEFLRVVSALKPKALLMENVPNMLQIANGIFRYKVLEDLANAGYRDCGVLVLDAKDFGVAQSRRRAIFFGVRDGLARNRNCFQLFSKAVVREGTPSGTVRDVLYDLPWRVARDDQPLPYPAAEWRSDLLDELRLDQSGRWYSAEYKLERTGGILALNNHHTKSVGERRAEIIRKLKPGQDARSLPEGLWAGSRSQKWRRMHPNRPAHTLTAQMHRDLSEWVHPKYNRWITVREAARLQSFHDGFLFKTSEWQMLKQLGNAVPPFLGRAVSSAAITVLRTIDGDLEAPIPDSVVPRSA